MYASNQIEVSQIDKMKKQVFSQREIFNKCLPIEADAITEEDSAYEQENSKIGKEDKTKYPSVGADLEFLVRS